MITLPATTVEVYERKRPGGFSLMPLDCVDPQQPRYSILSSTHATVSIQTNNNHASGLPVRDFSLYFCAERLGADQINNLEVLYLNDKEFVLRLDSVEYPVSLNNVQQVTPDCICIHFTTVSHHERGRLPWHLRLMGAFMPRSWLPKPGALLTV